MHKEGLSTDSGKEFDIPKDGASNDTSEYPTFDPEKARRLIVAVKSAKAKISENPSDTSGAPELHPEDRTKEAVPDGQYGDTKQADDDQDTAPRPTEAPTDQEASVDPETQDNQENREKSRAEQRLDALKKQIEQIDQDIEKTGLDKEDFTEEISRCEDELSRNFTEHEELSDKLVELRKEVKETRRNIFTSFATGFRLLKNQLFGDNEKIREILKVATDNNDINEKAKAGQKETEDKLEANEEEKDRLDADYANARDGLRNCDDKLSRLERQKAEVNKRLALLEEEVAEEKEREAWRAARQEIRSEMGSDNPRSLRRKLDARQRWLDESLAGELEELDSKYRRNPSRVDRLMRSEEELKRDRERSDEAEKLLRQEHATETAAINQQRERVEQYFPTLSERIKDIRENDGVNKALGFLKRRILMQVYRIA